MLSSREHFSMKNIPYAQSKRSAFTLMEVMIAVMIVSVVIASILQMRGNSSFIYERIEKNAKVNQYLSFLIDNQDFGYEKKTTTMKNLCDEFKLDSELRREFADIKLKLDYKKLDVLDMSEYDENSQLVIESGNSILSTPSSSASLLRIRIP
jgi:prepilin-type N-terminal cleavage/methylation domain-containing protein